ncbi:MAG TPA: hypothetical protein VL362_00440 [Patescibacteria group bacterium]|nr:hypothetical protein [Patescibacteria group bacterium]
MKLTSIDRHTVRRLYYHIRHNYFTLNNAVIALAAIVAIGWAWGAVSMMQRNYTLQRKLDAKQRELTLAALEVDTLKYQGRYYASPEYQDLAARESLGLANPGEKMLVLPPNSERAKKVDEEVSSNPSLRSTQSSNFQQWLDFFAGKNVPKT